MAEETTGKVLVQFRLPAGECSLAAAARRLGVGAEKLDADYGVVPTDPEDRLFSAMLERTAAPAVARRLEADSDAAEGVFSDPQIETFGPPED